MMHVLHVMNGASGGAAASTRTLATSLRALGIRSSAVCHDAGDVSDRRRLLEAMEGRVLFTPLYWWTRKIRAARWKRPLLEGLQACRTGLAFKSTSSVIAFARAVRATLVHTNTFTTP